MARAENLEFLIEKSDSPTSVEARQAQLADPGFGTLFTDHMVMIKYREGQGWHDARLQKREPIAMDPASSVLHYAQEIFEGMKAYRLADGTTALFRPEENARRFQASARRMAMPELPVSTFMQSIELLVDVERDWFPPVDGGSLYLRPFMFASEVFLGVRPAKEYLYMVIASPAGAYFKSGASAVSIWVSTDYSRAATGGTGAAKCGGNYAASLVAQAEAIERDCDQVVFLDAAEHRWVEELGGMNVFFVMDDGRLITPPLSGTILPGITRESIMMLAREEGLTVEERPYAIDQWEADANSGKLIESFACGTAAVVTPIGTVKSEKGDFTIGSGGPGQLTGKLRARLADIQRGVVEDKHGWVKRLF
ncbi:branched chain amino acid aminotransferase apoenzyme [Parasphingorhabdus marina DSM 22363]|uniref:Branched-chain-amino-acid aminotransferase n=1 Tax=Parasphingorhabdus marina DSM 22363 TaxID=1123272 RepID=A0A1N6D573_9SPHN|nr:branched-chain amino acid aminotransferase [Parasphingorhabdus marina]SIN65942.1 branched chain amino acid aminotransferase apoenzyme [Parasphingorhabdus marina DSM 22363]